MYACVCVCVCARARRRGPQNVKKTTNFQLPAALLARLPIKTLLSLYAASPYQDSTQPLFRLYSNNNRESIKEP